MSESGKLSDDDAEEAERDGWGWRDKNDTPSVTSSNLWPGCLFDSHCHLNLVLRLKEEHVRPAISNLLLNQET